MAPMYVGKGVKETAQERQRNLLVGGEYYFQDSPYED